MRLVTLYTVDNSYEANFIKEDMAEEGIYCLLTNEHITGLLPHMNGILGFGIQILIDVNDVDRARAILEKRINRNITTCPECHSANIRYGLGTTHRPKRILAIVIAFITVSPTRHIRHTYYCRDCRTEF